MFRTKFFAAAIATVALASGFAATAQAKELKPLPAKLYILNVDTSECFDLRDGTVEGLRSSQNAICPGLQFMPEARRIPAMRSAVVAQLCPYERGEDGKKVRNCRIDRTVRQLNRLNDYAVVSLYHQLGL